VKRTCVPSARSARRHLPNDAALFPDELKQILDRRPVDWQVLGTLENGRLILLINDDGYVGLFSPYDIYEGDPITYYGELLRDPHSYWSNSDRPISHARRNGQGFPQDTLKGNRGKQTELGNRDTRE
jgi:hypothetical protein